jgi:hypothetical protein
VESRVVGYSEDNVQKMPRTPLSLLLLISMHFFIVYDDNYFDENFTLDPASFSLHVRHLGFLC